jgi:hypothetical protein
MENAFTLLYVTIIYIYIYIYFKINGAQNETVIYLYPMFTNAFKYFIFLISYYFFVILYFYLSPVHMENAFRF